MPATRSKPPAISTTVMSQATATPAGMPCDPRNPPNRATPPANTRKLPWMIIIAAAATRTICDASHGAGLYTSLGRALYRESRIRFSKTCWTLTFR